MKIFTLLTFISMIFLSCNESTGPEPEQVSTGIWLHKDNSGLPGNSVSQIVIDNSGYKWIATDSGLAKFDGSEWTIYNTKNSGLTDDAIFELLIDSKDQIWIIYTSGALILFDRHNWHEYDISNSPIYGSFIETVAIDKHDNIWWGGYDFGLCKFDLTNWILHDELYGASISAIYADENDNIWIGTRVLPGTGKGLCKFDGINWKFYNEFTSDKLSNSINCILSDGPNSIWLGTERPLIHFVEPKYKLFYLLEPTSLSGIYCLAKDQNGNIWLSSGFFDTALIKFDGSDFTSYDPIDSGPEFYRIRSIVTDNYNNK